MARMVGCPDDETLSALVAGGLSEREREAIAIHAAACQACHAMLGHLAAGAETDDERDDAPELVLEPGTRVGRYTIESRIGAGGMGVVYAAFDRELERRVALKLLRPGRGDLNARERLVREARTLARLSHPNIVTVFDAGEHRGHVYVVMELIDGGNVRTWCAQEKRTQDEILDCMVAAGRGLAAAHAAGIVHRDVKPDNILVGRDDRVRVTDFGLARRELDPSAAAGEPDSVPASDAPTLTRTGTVLGTPLYMAPETLGGASSARADQWSYCATLYELLAGARPFPIEPGPRAVAIAAGKLEPATAGRRVAGPIRATLARGLRADPDARWDDMAALVTALTRARRRPRVLLAAAAAVLVLGGATTAIALRPSSPPGKTGKAALLNPTFVDTRTGCKCPFSACDGGCLSVCTAREFRIGDALPGISVKDRQEILQGVSASGDAVLFLAGTDAGCARDHLYLARLARGTFVPVDLTDQIDQTRFPLYEGCCTLSDDASTVVIAADRGKAWYAARLDGDRLGEPVLLLDLQLPANASGHYPKLSFDTRTLYFRIEQPGDLELPGALDGLYQAERDDVGVAFAGVHRLVGPARLYEYVTGISADGLSLFLVDEYRTRVLVRATTDEMFRHPAPTEPAAIMHGWRAMPLADCRRVLTTFTWGGCHGEDITYMEAVD
jgi:hypothetical protein